MPNGLLHFVVMLYLTICSCSRDPTSGTCSKKTYCVSSTSNSDNICQGYQNFTEKNTLYHYMKNPSKYFNSHETYVFEGSHHSPLHNFTLAINTVTNLTLVGSNVTKANIDCNGTGTTFSFKHSSNIIIEGLIFNSCIQWHKTGTQGGLATIIFSYCANISMLNMSVLKCVDNAFLILNTFGSVIIDNVEVANCSTGEKKSYFTTRNSIIYSHCQNGTNANVSIKNSRFIHNVNTLGKVEQKLTGGLSILNLQCPKLNAKVKIFNTTMLDNVGYNGGNLAIAILFYAKLNSSIEIADSKFEGGSAYKGAGMIVTVRQFEVRNFSCKDTLYQRKLLHVYNSNFTNNVAKAGSGVYMKYEESLLKCNTMNLVTFENVNFINNSVNCTKCWGGIAFHSLSLMVTDYLYHGNPQIQVILNNCNFQNNYVSSLNSATGVVFVKSIHSFQLNNTHILHNKATGMLGMSSNIILSQNVTILNNTGYNGGGILLCQNAVLYLKAYTKVTIAHNNALSTGGGICIETDFLESDPICFFQLGHDSLKNQSLHETISVGLHDNNAVYAGENIFGGSIHRCYMIQFNTNFNELIFKKVFKVPNNTINYSSISSPPRKVCLCQNMEPHCNRSPFIHIQKYPGETFSIDVVLVGQLDGSVPGTVQASLKSRNSSLKQGEYVQDVSSTACNQLNYTIFARHDHEELYLRVQRVGDISGFEESFISNNFTIHLKMKDCPLGFTHTNSKNSSCDCCRLYGHSKYVYCDISTQTLKRSPPVWIGTIEKENGSKIVAFHAYCPFDYCLSSKVDLFATNNSLSQDTQCAFNRTGVLCGSCTKGLSIVLGSTKCHSCSNYWILLLVPFALSGIGFLILLTIFNITIADGTLSGIIFYFNIIGSNLSIFFPAQSGRSITILTSLLKLIVSLVNLEIGASMCLYDGMDSYIKAWLEFCFPIYLWILTGCFILLAEGRCSWIVRRNTVKVLATFILISYTRLLTTITGALQVSKVQLELQGYELRWLPDGSIKYFRGKHIPLAIFSVMFGLLLLPFALCLLFIQCLQKVSEYRAFSWVNRLKPFFDVYTGPFTSSGRFWTGLLLLSRCILLLITAVNVMGDPNTALGAISIAIVLLLLIAAHLPAGLYRQRCLNTLEYSSLVNLGILSSLLFIFPKSTIISHVFVSFEIFVFIGVIVHHFAKQRVVHKSPCCSKVIC